MAHEQRLDEGAWPTPIALTVCQGFSYELRPVRVGLCRFSR
jgi:hypothetical protein